MKESKFSIVLLIISRYFLSLVMGLFPFCFDLKKEWYVIPLILVGVFLQIGLATYQMIPFIKKLKNERIP